MNIRQKLNDGTWVEIGSPVAFNSGSATSDEVTELTGVIEDITYNHGGFYNIYVRCNENGLLYLRGIKEFRADKGGQL